MSQLTGKRRFGRALGLAGALALGVTGALFAHDFWIVPIRFASAPGGTIEVHGLTGSRFPVSQSAVAVERVAEARLLGSAEEERITDLSIAGQSLVLKHAPRAAGQRVVAVALQPASRRVAATGLKRYIGLEGAPELVEELEKQGAFAGFDSATMKTQKFAKSVVEVGQGGPRAFSRTAGHGLEIVPLSDPGALHPGGRLAVRLLFRGAPVTGPTSAPARLPIRRRELRPATQRLSRTVRGWRHSRSGKDSGMCDRSTQRRCRRVGPIGMCISGRWSFASLDIEAAPQGVEPPRR